MSMYPSSPNTTPETNEETPVTTATVEETPEVQTEEATSPKKGRKPKPESNGQHEASGPAEPTACGTIYWIPTRQVRQDYNPRNPLLGTGLAKAGYTMFDGGEKDLVRLANSDNPEDRAAMCAAIEEHDKEFAPWAATMLTVGQTQPVEVKEVKGKAGKPDTYQLVNGARRTLANLYNWCKTGKGAEPLIQAKFAPKMNESATVHRQIVDNTAKKPNPIEAAEAIQRCVNQGQSVAKIAELYGRSEGWVYYVLSILELPEEQQARIRKGTLKPSVALAEKKKAKGGKTKEKKASKHVRERLGTLRKAIDASEYVDPMEDDEKVTLTLTAGELREFLKYYGE